MRDVVIVNAGMTNFCKHNKTNVELFSEVALDIIEKTRIEPNDIEALFLGNCLGDVVDGQSHMASFVHCSIGLLTSVPAVRFEAACATATIAIRNAILLVGSGVYDLVIAGGTEKTTSIPTPIVTRLFTMASDAQYEVPTGITFPGVFAMMAHMYADKHKIKLSSLKYHMAEIAVKNHYHGYKNTKAHFRKKIEISDVLNSTMIAEPLQLLDCCPFSDGASAIIIASADKAKDLTKKPIYVAGMGQTSAGSLLSQGDLTRVKSREVAAKMAYKEAGLLPRDIDVCELHDCFTIAEIVALEGLGFYDFGQGYNAATTRDTYFNNNKSKTVVNPSGGLKSRGHPIGATGAAQVTEIVEQLRGESGSRQVYGAKFGLVDTMGGDLGTVCNIILKG